MTATASATEEQVISRVAGQFSYAPSADVVERYTVSARRGFRLAIDREDGIWVIHDPVAGVHGAGPTPSDALGDFQRAVIEHIDVLERQAALSGDLQNQLQYLRDRL